MLKWIIPIIISVAFFGIIVLADNPQPSYDGILWHDGLGIEPTPLGAVRIWEDDLLVGATGFALTGTVLGEDYLTNSWDWGWYWSVSNQTIEIEDDWGNGTIDYWNFTEITLTGWNGRTDFNITQIYKTILNNGIKQEIEITNNLMNVSDYKIWLLNYLNPNTKFTYDGVEYKAYNLTELSISGNFDSIIPRVDFGDAYVYDYADLIRSGFNITDVHIGSAERFGSPENMYMAIGVSLGDNTFAKGERITYDPTYVTSYYVPTTFGDSCPGSNVDDWTNSFRLEVSDNVRTSTVVKNHRSDTCDYGMDFPNMTEVHGVEINLEGLSQCLFGCPTKPGAWVSVRMSWNAGTDWTDWKESAEFLAAGESVKTLGSPTDDWGHDWIINDTANELGDDDFLVQINFSRADASTTFAPPTGMDSLALRLNITTINPEIGWHSTMMANGSSLGSVIKIRASSSNQIPIECCGAVFNNGTGNFNFTYYDPSGPNSFSCWETIYIEDFPANFSVQVVAYDSTCSVSSDSTGSRYFNHSNTQVPQLSFIYPPNNSVIGGINITLEFNLNDPEDDYSSMWLYFARSIEGLLDNFYFFSFKDNDNYTQFVDIIPEAPMDDLNDFIALYGMNNDSTLGENDTHVFDYTGRYNGTAQNTIVRMTGGKFRGGFEFGGAGSDDGILIGENTSFNSFFADGTGACIGAWMKRDTSAASMRIVSKGGPTLGCFEIRVGAASLFSVQIQTACTFATKCESVSVSSSLTTGKFQHVMMCHDSATRKIRKFIDGNQVGAETGACGVINATKWELANKLTVIGASTNTNMSALSSEFDGVIDHVRIWNKTLTNDAVSALFELEKGMYYWNLTAVEVYKHELNSTNGTSEFQLGCNINCSLGKLYNSLFDCAGETVSQRWDVFYDLPPFL